MTILQTSLGALAIELAKPAELSIVMGIIEEAAAWLHARGITEQWSSPLPERFWERMKKEIAKGEAYIARRADGSAVGTLRFEWYDAELWRDDPAGGGYVHSFAVGDHARGHGIGAAMLTWAREHVRKRGKKYLRLDCWGANKPLCDYYAGLGFTFCGMVLDEEGPNALFQMET